MFKQDAVEAAGIMQRSLQTLVSLVPSQGRSGADLRSACYALGTNADALILGNVAGPPLANCFELARQAGVNQAQLATVRTQTLAEMPVTVGATMIQYSIIGVCLSTEARVIADMDFVSRQDVEALQAQMNAAFNEAEEAAADAMDQMTFQAFVALHAGLIFFLIDTARPLPRMLNFAFARVMPTLVLAHRLYADPGRADQLLAENKIVHPAFAPAAGRGLSS